MNKDIELIGLGNGLVDLMFEVSEIELNDFNLKKGEMLLVETSKQEPILKKFAERSQYKCSGGSAANTIIAFSQLGGKSAYKTVLGKDDLGKFYAKEFEDLGIVLNADFVEDLPTGTCVVLITPDTERTMHTALGATALFNENHINEDIIARSEWLYIEGYKFSEDSSSKAIFKAIETAKKHNTKISVTFSDVFITNIFKSNLSKVVEVADLVFCNDQEAMSYTNTNDAETAFNELAKICPNVIVTQGKNGSLVKWNNEILQIPSYKANPLDTTGAGDMFAGAFLYGLIKTNSPKIAGHLASYAASVIVSQFGARISGDMNEIKRKISEEFGISL